MARSAVPSNFAFRTDHTTVSLYSACQHSTMTASVRQSRSWPGAAKSGGRTERGGVGSQEGGTGAAARFDAFQGFRWNAQAPYQACCRWYQGWLLIAAKTYCIKCFCIAPPAKRAPSKSCRKRAKQQLWAMGQAGCEGGTAKSRKTSRRGAGGREAESSPLPPFGPRRRLARSAKPLARPLVVSRGLGAAWHALARLGPAEMSNQSRAFWASLRHGAIMTAMIQILNIGMAVVHQEWFFPVQLLNMIHAVYGPITKPAVGPRGGRGKDVARRNEGLQCQSRRRSRSFQCN